MARARRSANNVASSHASASPACGGAEDICWSGVGSKRAGTARGDRLARGPGDGRTGGEVLEAADQATCAAAVRRIRADVADLTGKAVGAAQDAAVEHDARRDARCRR